MALIPKQYEKAVFYGGVLVAGFLVYKLASKGVAGTVKDITAGVVGGAFDAVGGVVAGVYSALPEAVQPSSKNNIVYGSISSAGAAISGDKNWTLGSWLYKITH